MNGMPGVRREAFWRQGMVVPALAYVSKVRTIDQRIHVDCYDPETAQQWLRLPLFVLGGSAESFLAIPPAPLPRSDVQQPEEEDGAQVIVLPRHKQGPIALGCMQHPTSGFQEPDTEQAEVQDDADHPLPTTHKEHIWTHAGVRLQLTNDGSLVIDVQKSKKPVRIQLSGNGRLRVSRGGSAGGRLVLWHRLRGFLEDLGRWGNEADVRITELQLSMQTVLIALVAGGIVPASELARFTAVINREYVFYPDPAVPSMAASAIDVSKDTD